jgi:hypothetical protein
MACVHRIPVRKMYAPVGVSWQGWIYAAICTIYEIVGRRASQEFGSNIGKSGDFSGGNACPNERYQLGQSVNYDHAVVTLLLRSSFHDHRNPLSPADACRRKSIPRGSAAQLMKQSQH